MKRVNWCHEDPEKSEGKRKKQPNAEYHGDGGHTGNFASSGPLDFWLGSTARYQRKPLKESISQLGVCLGRQLATRGQENDELFSRVKILGSHGSLSFQGTACGSPVCDFGSEEGGDYKASSLPYRDLLAVAILTIPAYPVRKQVSSNVNRLDL